MDDMTAFERQLSGEITGLMGPVRPVDDLAVFDAIVPSTRSQNRELTRFSAVKFVVAGVIVTLFGSILLAGILTTPQGDETAPAGVTESPSPMTTEELLSGMVTEEVEPGVYRVINDGIRDIAHLGGMPYWGQHVMADDTGGVWRITMDDRYFRLGTEEEWPLNGQPVLVFADGRLVAASELPAVLGWGSATAEELGLDSPLLSIEVQGDDTVWLLHDRGTLVRVPPDGVPEAIDWKQAYDGAVDGRNLVVTADGEVWLVGRWLTDLGPIDAFLRFDGTDWEVVPAPDEVAQLGDSRGWGVTFDLGPDGTLWTVGDALSPHRHLARYDGSGWTISGPDDGVRSWGGQRVGVWLSWIDVVRLAPDGSVWVNGWGPDDRGCGGLARFDTESWASFLPDACIYGFDIAPDGAVWVVASEPPHAFRDQDGMEVVDVQTYVITPEAVAVAGS